MYVELKCVDIHPYYGLRIWIGGINSVSNYKMFWKATLALLAFQNIFFERRGTIFVKCFRSIDSDLVL
jgi:hypothetical protein